jgi:dephospho-CoA kinase
LRVGLTGNIGSGKSSVARLLAARGAVVIDADALARQATDDPAVLERIRQQLGSELVVAGALDRAATARRVFEDPAARALLDGIVHPWVAERRRRLDAEAAAASPMPRVVVHDVPLLFEVGLDADVDVVVVVYAPLEARLARLARRSGMSRADALARDAAQLPLDEKARRADYVVDNSGTPEALKQEVTHLWEELYARSPVGAPPG